MFLTTPLGSPSHRSNLNKRCGSMLASTGSLVAVASPSNKPIERDVARLSYDTMRGVTREDLMKRKRMLTDHPKGKWVQNDKDLPPAISDTLEKAFTSGELKCGVWDNGLFRDFDLAKMQEIPGLKELKRVGCKR